MAERACNEIDWAIERGRTDRLTEPSPHRLPELIAAQPPDAIALVDGERRMTYGELVQGANRYANGLRALGAVDGDRIGVCLDRSAELIVVLLGVLTAGCSYVPMEPGYPAERLAYTVGNAEVRLVITEETAPDFGATQTVDRLRLRTDDSRAPHTNATADDPAYVIYTSGSTGRPKGVVVAHRAVTSLLAATRADFGFTEQDRWSWFHSVAFDFSVWEIWGALLTGAALVVVPYWTCRSPEDFHRLLSDERITVLNQTPSAFAQLLAVDRERGGGRTPRLLVFAGEPLDTRILTEWFDRHPDTHAVNMYGITETTVHVTAQTLRRADAVVGYRSVGRAIPGWSVRVVDEQHRPLPLGVTGEIAVGGDGLAIGYLNQPELTARRFIRDEHGERIYLSGDRGRMLPDGRLECLGRLDSQVKLRGHRIELDEIRAVLVGHPTVTAAAVILAGEAEQAALHAYVVGPDIDPVAVRRFAARQLPDYMIPSTVTVLPALPLTPNGKLDRIALPAPQTQQIAELPDLPEVDGALGTVLQVWQEVFGRTVGADDEFFDLGGNSTLALEIAKRLRANGVSAVARVVYEFPTPGQLAKFAESA
ncbi:MAG TPA: amino acid adenylation domain-containing protein [Pseudonocardiaceae bacterium]